ncbi:hypothetical protein [Collimonas arenae]|nr:hypothetical protein [Collimonas arenae]
MTKVAGAITLLAFGAMFATSSFAETTWQKNHPRRTEVNHRLANQNARIHQEVKSGQITGAQAAGLHKEDHQVRQEERSMASQDGGHITKQERKTLNQQENGISQQIGK